MTHYFIVFLCVFVRIIQGGLRDTQQLTLSPTRKLGIYTDNPCYGSRRISVMLKRRGYDVGRKKTRKYMRIMGLEVFYPKPRTTIRNKEHSVYPYLLRGVSIERNNQGSRTVERIRFIHKPILGLGKTHTETEHVSERVKREKLFVTFAKI